MTDPDTSRECDDCKAGVHVHLGGMYQPWYDGLKTRAEKVDAIDCKNRTKDGQCICHLWLEEKKKIMGF